MNESLTIPNGDAKLENDYGDRLLPQVIDTFAAEDPEYIIAMTVKSLANNSLDFTALSTSQLANAVNYMSHWLDKTLGPHLGQPETIGFVGVQDFRYWVMEFACIKTGRPLLIPSSRNALSNTASLLSATKCKIMFCSSLLKTHAEGLESLVNGLQIFEIPEIDEMIERKSKHYPYIKTWAEAQHDVVLIVHTSGSTGTPKPIYFTNAFLRRSGTDRFCPGVPDRELAGPLLCTPGKICYLGTPFFHLSGIGFGTAALFNRYTIVTGPLDQPANGKMVCDIAKSLKISGMVMVPSLCDSVFIDHGEEMKPYLQSMTHVCWLGGPLAQRTGDWIIENLPGVTLWQVFGSTETHLLPMLVAPRSHWSYMDFHPLVGPKLERTAPDSDLYEVVSRPLPDARLSTYFCPVFGLFPEKKEWRSGDLVRRCQDPGFENLVIFEGRVDDMMLLSNGLKVNPLHVEGWLQGHQALNGCLVFGGGYAACGILIEARDETLSKESLIELVWPLVARANVTVPEHARVTRERVLVAASEKAFIRAGKGTVVRAMTLKLYENEIAEVFGKRF